MKLLSVAAVLALAGTASADTKSWTAVKGMLPDNVNVIVGANLSTLRGTSLYGAVMPTLLAKGPDAKKAIDLAKTACAIDLHAAIVDATFAMGDDERGIVVLTLDKSIDQKRVIDCATKLIAQQAAATTPTATVDVEAKGGGLKGGTKKQPPPTAKQPDAPKAPPPPPPPAPKLVTKTTGKVVEYGLDTDAKRLYVAWLAADIVAIATDPDDKPLLDKMLAGKGTKGTINTFLAKASPNAAVWLATTKAQPVPTGGTMKGAFGTVDATKGNVNVDMSIVMSSAKDAKGFVDQSLALIASAKGSVPPQFQKLVDALKLTASAESANMKLSATEKELVSVITLALMNL
ncbi:MAG: hypothetical protein M4D80_36395 [Myxococcota bacterium]|nr:hypothetical protein [Deltaproteobacteria bacterium]MDQ3340671.1 hypothetical protein [Myxococcota bacterium]